MTRNEVCVCGQRPRSARRFVGVWGRRVQRGAALLWFASIACFERMMRRRRWGDHLGRCEQPDAVVQRERCRRTVEVADRIVAVAERIWYVVEES